jgi:peptide-methionine (R)-S-oxide reductase
MANKLKLSDDEWRQRLTPEEYQVLREHGTERAGTGCFLGTKTPGTYVCAGCGNPLFKSGTKFESGTGWPSFTKPVLSADPVANIRGSRLRHAAHRGALRPLRRSPRHVFPRATAHRSRYCMNSRDVKHVPEGQPIVLVDSMKTIGSYLEGR